MKTFFTIVLSYSQFPLRLRMKPGSDATWVTKTSKALFLPIKYVRNALSTVPYACSKKSKGGCIEIL